MGANKAACDDAERAYYEKLSGCKSAQAEAPAAKKEGGSASEEEPAKVDGLVSASGSSEDMALVKKLNALEVENKQLKKVTDDLPQRHQLRLHLHLLRKTTMMSISLEALMRRRARRRKGS